MYGCLAGPRGRADEHGNPSGDVGRAHRCLLPYRLAPVTGSLNAHKGRRSLAGVAERGRADWMTLGGAWLASTRTDRVQLTLNQTMETLV